MMTLEEIKPMLEEMSWQERRRVADWLVPDASETAIMCRAWDIKNQTERHM